MKVLCIHIDSRLDRLKSFTEGVGKNIEYEFIKAVEPNDGCFVDDYFLCKGDLCCRASHAKCWLECVASGENTLIFEDDVKHDNPENINWWLLGKYVEALRGKEVGIYKKDKFSNGITLAYGVTPYSAKVLLNHHLGIVNPVSIVDMSVDFRVGHLGDIAEINLVLGTQFGFYQTGLRAESDNEWAVPENLGVKIHRPPFN